MKKRLVKLASALSAFLIGILLIGFGFETKLGHPINSICLTIGILISILGVIKFIRIALYD